MGQANADSKQAKPEEGQQSQEPRKAVAHQPEQQALNFQNYCQVPLQAILIIIALSCLRFKHSDSLSSQIKNTVKRIRTTKLVLLVAACLSIIHIYLLLIGTICGRHCFLWPLIFFTITHLVFASCILTILVFLMSSAQFTNKTRSSRKKVATSSVPKLENPSKAMEPELQDRPRTYNPGDDVLCEYINHLFRAQIKDVIEEQGGRLYIVHYVNWSDLYDEILTDTEADRRLKPLVLTPNPSTMFGPSVLSIKPMALRTRRKLTSPPTSIVKPRLLLTSPLMGPGFMSTAKPSTTNRRKVNSDMALIVGEEKFMSHRHIFCSKSPVFTRLLAQHSAEDNQVANIPIYDFNSAAIEALMQWIYGERVEHLSDTAEELYKIAIVYQISNLKKYCTDFMSRGFNEENVVSRLILAYTYNEGHLKDHALDFLSNRTPPVYTKILQSAKWIKFSNEQRERASEIIESFCQRIQ